MDTLEIVALICFALFCITLGIGFIYRYAKCHDNNRDCERKHNSISTGFFIISALLIFTAIMCGIKFKKNKATWI